MLVANIQVVESSDAQKPVRVGDGKWERESDPKKLVASAVLSAFKDLISVGSGDKRTFDDVFLLFLVFFKETHQKVGDLLRVHLRSVTLKEVIQVGFVLELVFQLACVFVEQSVVLQSFNSLKLDGSRDT